MAWKSKQQVSIALLSTEVDYVTNALAAKGLWIKTIIEELDILSLQKRRYSNKHIQARHHFIRELVE